MKELEYEKFIKEIEELKNLLRKGMDCKEFMLRVSILSNKYNVKREIILEML